MGVVHDDVIDDVRWGVNVLDDVIVGVGGVIVLVHGECGGMGSCVCLCMYKCVCVCFFFYYYYKFSSYTYQFNRILNCPHRISGVSMESHILMNGCIETVGVFIYVVLF